MYLRQHDLPHDFDGRIVKAQELYKQLGLPDRGDNGMYDAVVLFRRGYRWNGEEWVKKPRLEGE